MTDPRAFVLCAHRGNMADSPENTLLAFASAERVGADEIELDVRITCDNVLVVIHDRTVARTAATSTPHLHTPIEEMTYDEVRTVDLGGGQWIPTLQEVLDATSILLAVEIKAPGAARGLAHLLQDCAESDRARCMVTSFDPLSLSDFTDELAGLPRGTALHIPDPASDWRDHLRRLEVSTVIVPLARLCTSLVKELHDAGYLVGASLIEGPGDVRRIVELDVDTTASNAPEYARHLLLSNEQFTTRFLARSPQTDDGSVIQISDRARLH